MALSFEQIVALTNKALQGQIRLARDKRLAVILGNGPRAQFTRMKINAVAKVALRATPVIAYGVAKWQATDTWVRGKLHLPPKKARSQTRAPRTRQAPPPPA